MIRPRADRARMRMPDAAESVERDPLRREPQPQQQAHDRHPDREGDPALQPAGPQRREERERRDDEEPDVDVVHRDARLDEHHPVGEDQDPGDDRDRPAPEEDPREQVEGAERQRAEDDARQPPAEGVATDGDGGRGARRREREQLLAVGGRVLLVACRAPTRRPRRTGAPRRRTRRSRSARSRRRSPPVPSGATPATWTSCVAAVVDDPGDRPRHRRRDGDRRRRGALAVTHVDPPDRRVTGRVDRGAADAGDVDEVAGLPVDGDRVGDRRRRGRPRGRRRRPRPPRPAGGFSRRRPAGSPRRSRRPPPSARPGRAARRASPTRRSRP